MGPRVEYETRRWSSGGLRVLAGDAAADRARGQAEETDANAVQAGPVLANKDVKSSLSTSRRG